MLKISNGVCPTRKNFIKIFLSRTSNGVHIFFFLIFSFSSTVREVSHKINGLRSLSIDQLSSLKSAAFSILKWESKDIVACKFKGDNLLCSNKNCCFLVIYRASASRSEGRKEGNLL